MTKSKVVLCLVASVLCGTPAAAQFSKVPDLARNIVSAAEGVQQLWRQNGRDERKIYDLLRETQDKCKAAAAALAGFGEPLAAAASSPFEDRLREPGKLAYVTGQLFARDMAERSERLMNLINSSSSSRGSNFELEFSSGLEGLIYMARARVGECEELRKKSEDLMKWLRESLQAAKAMRDNAAKPAEALDAALRQLELKEAEQNAEVQRLFDQWKVLLNRSQEAARRHHEAFRALQAALTAPESSSSYTANSVAAHEKWTAAGNEDREVAKYEYEALERLMSGCNEVRSRLGEIARLMNDLSDFRKNANPETISKRIADFDQWTKLFERDMSR